MHWDLILGLFYLLNDARISVFYVYISAVTEIEPKALSALGNYFNISLYSQSYFYFLFYDGVSQLPRVVLN